MTTPITTSTTTSVITTPSASTLVYSLTNIYQSFSFKLSVDGNRYKLWRRIFLDICQGAKVTGHITGDSKPSDPTDDDWYSVDSRIKTWFYNTCEPNLLQIITKEKCTAKDLWDEIETFFLNNKMSRALQLQETFRNTKKGALSITEYCHTLKNLVDTLDDVGTPISEQELVLQILRNLPASYNSIVNVITNTKPFPSFLDARNMLLLHESREDNSEDTTDVVASPSTALFTTTNNTGKGKNKTNKNKGNGRGAPKGAGNSNGSVGGSGFAGNTGGTSQLHAQQVFQHGHTHSAHIQYSSMHRPHGAFFAAPGNGLLPTPQSPAPGFQPPHMPQSVQHTPTGYGYPPHTSYYGQPQPAFGGYVTSPRPQLGYQQQPTDLASVFSSMSLQQPSYDPNNYMDTGASSHMSFNSGL